MGKNDDILKLHSKYQVRVGLLSDIHGGCTRAVSPPIFHYNDAGNLPQKYVANEAQLMLYELWKRDIKLFRKFKVQRIFVVGDAFTGDNYFESGAYTFIDKPQQIELVAELLEEVYKATKADFYIWKGTKYHESKSGQQEMHKTLTDKLQIRGIPAKYMANVSYVELYGGKDIKTEKPRMRRLFVAHEAPTALVHPATLMSRDINWSLQANASGSALPVDGIIRAHTHNHLHVDHSGIHAVQLPCWQGYIPYKSTIKYFFKLQPIVGGAIMLMDEYGRLDFWGGSYPFGFDKKDKLKIHRLCVGVEKLKLNKRLPKPFGVNRRCLSKK